MTLRLALFFLPAWALAAPPEEPAQADECAVLAALDPAEEVGAPVHLDARVVPAAGELPARCRIVGRIDPEVGVEIWLPLDGWNGKLLVAGCYGLCGSLRSDSMEDAAARGYATATTDGGHDAARDPDQRWAADPAREDDFGHRAVHVATALARALIAQFYGEAPAHAYFRGCSTGGRQALVAASRYPEDFDGIVAGAPVHPLLSVPHMIWADRANTAPDGSPVLSEADIALLHQQVLAACDAADGLADGIVGDPERCMFDPRTLLCTGDGPADCLPEADVAAIERIYSGPVMGNGRWPASSGAARGSEFTWAAQLLSRGAAPPAFRQVGEQWRRFHAFEPDPSGEAVPEFDFDRDLPRLLPAAARSGFTADLGAFRRRDGRLIVWHGWADESLQPAHTLAFWREALRENGGAESLAGFAALFMLPGVMHCGGGPGAGDVDFLTALERWVEEDEPPAMLLAWRTRESVPAGVRQPRFPPAGDVLLKRPLFPYPGVAYYRGEGDPLDPASYLQR